ncbi:hypothetical protein Q7P37_005368 [Cladosporium fusiforme]
MCASWFRSHVQPALQFAPVKRKNLQLTGSDIEESLYKLCVFPQADSKGRREPLSQERFKHIAQTLKELDTYDQRQDDQRWQMRPRIFSILINIGASIHMHDFVREKIHDISLPYTPQTLPKFIHDEEIRQQFLEQQICVLTDARHLENSESHVNFAEDASEHMQFVRRLGHGGYGWVDLVSSNLSAKMYARKRVLRSNSTAELDRKAQQSLVAEIETMKKLSYLHLTRIVGSYTDPKCIAYLMDPVAEANLHDFLDPEASGAKFETSATLRPFFGCLAGAVDYLHENSIRHRDLKLQNVLIKDNTVYLADFGTALDWSKSMRQTTQDRDTPGTPNYVAPEVATRGATRNAASDMWSLGVVFLEIATVLKGFPLSQWHDFRQRKASYRNIDRPWRTMEAVDDWLNVLQVSGQSPEKDNEPLAWIKSLLHRKPELRPSARSMIRTIKESPYFNDFCCDDCIERFQDPGFFFESPSNLFVDRQAIDAQIRSMEPPPPPISEQFSTIQSWIEQTEPDLSLSAEEDAWAIHVGAQEDVFHQQTAPGLGIHGPSGTFRMNKERKLHMSGAFYVDFDGDQSDDDSSSSATSKIRPTSPDTTGPLYYVVEDSSSDGYGSVQSDSDDERRSAAEDERAYLAAIPEEDDEHPCPSVQDTYEKSSSLYETDKQCPQLEREVESDLDPELEETPSGKVVASNHSSQIASTVDIKLGPPDHQHSFDSYVYKKPGNRQEDTPPTLASPSDPKEDLGDDWDAIHHKIFPKLHAVTPISSQDASTAEDSLSPVADSIGSDNARTQKAVHWRAAEVVDVPKDPQQCISPPIIKSSQYGQQPAKDTQSPHVLASPRPSHSRPGTTDQTRTPLQILLAERRRRDSRFPDMMKQPSPPTARVMDQWDAKGAGPIYDTERPTFDPLDFIEKTFRDVKDTPSQATSVMSDNTKRGLARAFRSWGRANERLSQHLEHYSRKGNAGAVRALLRGGSDPGTLDKPRPRPIVYAVQGATQRHNKCVKALIEYHCDVNCAWRGKTPIHWALENLYFEGSLSLLGMLLQAGAELCRADFAKEYPLTKLFSGPRDSPLEMHQIAALALVLHPSFAKSTGIDVNVRQPASLDTALHLAVQRRTPYAVSLLLHRGANINATNASGTTPLLMAASQWQLYLTSEQRLILTFLLEHDSLKVNAVGGSFGRTALHQAARVGCVGAIVMLLERGADVLLRDKDGKSAISFCKAPSSNDDPKRVRQFREACQILEEREGSLGL